jgi:hypothetical protein
VFNTAKTTGTIPAMVQVARGICLLILLLGGCADSTPPPLETNRPQVAQSTSATCSPDHAWGPHKSNWSTIEAGMKADEWTEGKKFSTPPGDAVPFVGDEPCQ